MLRIDADTRHVAAGWPLAARLRAFSRALLAARCAGCEHPLTATTAGRPVATGATPRHPAALESWCSACQSKLVWWPHPAQAETFEADGWRLHAVDYLDPVPTVVASMKFGQQLWAARALAELLEAAQPQCPPVDCLVPVPLGPRRLRERGFNQAQLLAQQLAKRWGCSVLPTALRRTHDTDAQSRLNKADRADNMADAFAVNPQALRALRGQRIGLVDDVFTTGATLQAAAQCLRHAGCAGIGLITIARTP